MKGDVLLPTMPKLFVMLTVMPCSFLHGHALQQCVHHATTMQVIETLVEKVDKQNYEMQKIVRGQGNAISLSISIHTTTHNFF